MTKFKPQVNKYSFIFIALFLLLGIFTRVAFSNSPAQTEETTVSNETTVSESDFLLEETENEQATVPETLLASLPTLQHAQGAFIVDGENGQILFQQAEDEQIDIASITKLLTIYLIYQALEAGEISLEDEVWVSDEAYEMSQDYDIANVPLRQDISYNVEELIEAVGINSANGAALTLAEHLDNSQEAFINRMEEQLAQWQLENYTIENVTGLSHSYSPQDPDSNTKGPTNQFDALTVATIAHHLVADYPQYLEYTQIPKTLFREDTSDRFEISNPNLMIEQADSNLALPAVDGLMVTTSPEDGFSLVITLERDGLRAIIICLGIETEELAYQEAQQLIDYTFSTYRTEAIITENMEVTQVNLIPVENGTQTQASLAYDQALNLVVPIIDTAPRLVYEFQAVPSLETAGYLTAPLEAGSEVGDVQVDVAGYELPILPTGSGKSAPVVISEDIEQASRTALFWRSLTTSFSKAWDGTRRFFTDLFN